jgi:TolA-binding protein
MRAAVSNPRGVRPALTAVAPAIAGTARRSAPPKAESPLLEKEPKAAAQRAVAEAPEVAGRASDLDGELRLLDAARRAIVKGEVDVARSYLKDYQRKFPSGTLNQEAAALLERARATE